MAISQSTKDNILSLLENCEFDTFFTECFADDFKWAIKGTSILSGVYLDKEQFLQTVIGRLNKVVQPGWRMHILATYIDGDIMVIEMRGEVKALNGSDYNNEYCWILKFVNDKIVETTAYYDSLLVNKTLTENELKES